VTCLSDHHSIFLGLMPYGEELCANSGFIAIIKGFWNFPYVDNAQQPKRNEPRIMRGSGLVTL